MRKFLFIASVMAATSLSGCAGAGGLVGRQRPDEFAVTRNAPLIVPPNYALVPPKPGAPTPTGGNVAGETLQALFGGPAPRSVAEGAVLNRAGSDRAEPGIRSTVGDAETNSVDKGTGVRTILAAPQGAGQDANAGIGAPAQTVPTTLPNADTKQPAPAPTPTPQS